MTQFPKLLFGFAFIALTVGCSANPRSKFVTQIENDLNTAKEHIAKDHEIETARVAAFDAVLTGIEESPYEGEATFEIVCTRDLSFEDYTGPCRLKMVYTVNYLYSKQGWEMTDYRYTGKSHDAFEAPAQIKAAIHQTFDGKSSDSFKPTAWPDYESPRKFE